MCNSTRSRLNLNNSKTLQANRYTSLKKRVKKAKKKKTKKKQPPPPIDSELPKDLDKCAEALFGFKPKDYQVSLLGDKKKRIVVRWSRQERPLA